jgi:hypothetical protein
VPDKPGDRLSGSLLSPLLLAPQPVQCCPIPGFGPFRRPHNSSDKLLKRKINRIPLIRSAD